MQTITTVTRQIRDNIRDYEDATGIIVKEIEVSDSAYDYLLMEDSDKKNMKTINGSIYLDAIGHDAPKWVLVKAYPFSSDAVMYVDEDMAKYSLEFTTEEETKPEQKQETVNQQILEFISDYEWSNGCRPNLIRIDPTLLKYVMYENEGNPTMFRAEEDFYLFNGIEMEPTVFPSSNNFPISLCHEVKYAVNIPVRNA